MYFVLVLVKPPHSKTSGSAKSVYSLLNSGDFCGLLVTFANSLDDQDRHSVGNDQGLNHFDTLIVFLKEIFEKVNFEKKSRDDNKSSMQRVKTREIPSLSIYSICSTLFRVSPAIALSVQELKERL